MNFIFKFKPLNLHLVWIHTNDPFAGSPTKTLLRLLLPLDYKI